MIELTFKEAKEGFFDPAKVLDAVDAATRGILSRFGAFVRRTARSSIRKRKGPSKPGKPPSSHVGLLKDFISFSYDSQRRTVVIGPTLIGRPTGAPHILEYGGRTTIRDHKWKTREGERVLEIETKQITIKPRPYMHPALAAELPEFPAMWANSVR